MQGEGEDNIAGEGKGVREPTRSEVDGEIKDESDGKDGDQGEGDCESTVWARMRTRD